MCISDDAATVIAWACVPVSVPALFFTGSPASAISAPIQVQYSTIKEISLNKYVYIYAPSRFVASALGLLEAFVLAICLVSIAGNNSIVHLMKRNV